MSTKDPTKEANRSMEKLKNRRSNEIEVQTREKLKEIFKKSQDKQNNSTIDQPSSSSGTQKPKRRGKLKQAPLVEKEPQPDNTRSGRRRMAIIQEGNTIQIEDNIEKSAQNGVPAQSETAATASDAHRENNSMKKVRIRLFPIWLRLVIVFILLVFALTAGSMVGYGIIGGGKPFDVLKQSTWTHIVDLINKEK